MGLLDFFAQRQSKAITASPEVLEAIDSRQYNSYQKLGGTNKQVVNAWEQAQTGDYAWIYKTQPAVRTVIDYIATNVSQLPLKLYERVGDTERKPRYDHPAAQTMRRPYAQQVARRWIFNIFADFLIYDNAYALKFDGPNNRRTLVRIPPHMMGLVGASRFTVDGYRVHRYDGSVYPAQDMMIPPSQVIHWVGYDPDDALKGISRLETLRQILAEEAAAVTASTELLKSGLQKEGWIYRPLDAPVWSNEAREFFETDLYNRITRSDKRWPVLEEGMEVRDLGITPKDAEMLDSRRFTLEQVAREYGMCNVPPETEDERKQFYADVLPPLVEEFAEVLDLSLLSDEYGLDDYYFEFDLNEKLRGDPIQRFQAITAAVGAPWLLRNEARAMENRPPVEGGDDLIVPLNVMEEGEDSPRLPAPNVMPPQDPTKPPADGSYRENGQAGLVPQSKAVMLDRRAAQMRRRKQHASTLERIRNRFLARQEGAVKTALTGSEKAVAASRWAKWEAELGRDLVPALDLIAETEGDLTVERLGGLAFDSRQVANYVEAAAKSIAKELNDSIRDALPDAEDVAAFYDARRSESAAWALSTAQGMTSFAQKEAAAQSPQTQRRVKTWIVTADNSAHPELDGETVPLGDSFSNGTDGPPADHPGCECMMEIS